MSVARLFIEGQWRDGAPEPVLDKYDGSPLGEVHGAAKEQVEVALRGLAAGQARVRLSPYDRFRILDTAADLLARDSERAVTTVIDDTGFTTTDARREVERAVQTLQISAEEARRLTGEMVPIGGAPGGDGRLAFTLRRPLGVVCAITPFNSPLNTLVHKVGPAIAAGNAVIVKPASATPFSAGLLVEILLNAGLPAELVALVNGPGGQVGRWLADSPIPAFYAFTGSTEVGEQLAQAVGTRRTQLELGSLSSTVVCEDANLAAAVELCINAAFRKAGQVCTSVQRLFVHVDAYAEFQERLTRALAGRVAGDPRDEKTFVGPMISGREADRIESWIRSATGSGAQVLTGGGRRGQVVEPTVLSEVPASAKLMCQEAFGPVVSLVPFDDFESALADVDGTPYGLAAGIFTADIGKALRAVERLRMGSVHINQTSSNRVDLMPYGGVKQSGSGLEGPRYAVSEMTEVRLVTIGAL